MDKPTTLKRSQVLPLHEPADIYAVLSRLTIGEQVPPTVYITDYKDDIIPPWTVGEVERCASGLLILTVYDPTTRKQPTLFDPGVAVATDIFTLETKTLRGPFWCWHEGCPASAHARNPLGDCRQWARQIVDKAHKAERLVVA